MYINRALLLMLGVAFVFFPAIEEWVLSDGLKWYRPWQVWLLIVVAAYWNQRSRYPDDL
jgi:hypothetical protein